MFYTLEPVSKTIQKPLGDLIYLFDASENPETLKGKIPPIFLSFLEILHLTLYDVIGSRYLILCLSLLFINF